MRQWPGFNAEILTNADNSIIITKVQKLKRNGPIILPFERSKFRYDPRYLSIFPPAKGASEISFSIRGSSLGSSREEEGQLSGIQRLLY